MKERPPKPDVSWLTEHTWHTCCDLEVRISVTVIYCTCSFLKMIEMSMKIVGKHCTSFLTYKRRVKLIINKDDLCDNFLLHFCLGMLVSS